MRTSNLNTKHWNWVYSLGLEWMEAAATAFSITPLTKTSPPNHDITSDDNFEITEACPEVNEAGTDFVSTITHELRTPLTSIRAFSEILQDNPDLDAAQRSRYLDIIVKESEKLSEIINQTLDLVEVEAESIEWSVGKIDMNQIFEECLASTRTQMQQANVQLQARLPDNIPPIYANRDRISQVILILLLEAIKCADDEAGWVGVRGRIEADTLQIDIFNNGSIIPLHEESGQNQLQPLAATTQTVMYQLPNLNLVACYDILGHYGGQLYIGHDAPHGLRFTLTLPLCTD